MNTFNLNQQADIANFHAFAAGYARDNRAYTETGTAAELLDKLLNDEYQQHGYDEATALGVPADQVAAAKKAFLFAAAE